MTAVVTTDETYVFYHCVYTIGLRDHTEVDVNCMTVTRVDGPRCSTFYHL